MTPVLYAADGNQIKTINCASGVAPKSEFELLLTVHDAVLKLLVVPKDDMALLAPLTRAFDAPIRPEYFRGTVADVESFTDAVRIRGELGLGRLGPLLVAQVLAQRGELDVMFESTGYCLLLEFTFRAPDGPEYCGRMVLSEEEAEAYFDFTDDTVEIPEPMPHWIDEGLADGATIP